MLATLGVSRPWKGLLSWSLATRKQLTQPAPLNLHPTTVKSSWPTMVPSESLMPTPTVASPRRSPTIGPDKVDVLVAHPLLRGGVAVALLDCEDPRR